MQTMTADNPMMQSQKFLVFLVAAVRPLRPRPCRWVSSSTGSPPTRWTLAQSHYVYKKYPMPPNAATARATATPRGQGGRPAKTGAKTGAKAGVKAAGSLAATASSPPVLGKAKKKAEPEAARGPPPETPKVVRQQPHGSRAARGSEA